MATRSALLSAADLGYDSAGIVAVIRTIQPGHFYKSMTANHDAKVWQDVYHVPDSAGALYIKFTDNGVRQMTLLSFKAK